MQNEERDLRDRTKAFALQIIRMFAVIPKTTQAQVVGKQLLRSGTSVGANYREAYRGRSQGGIYLESATIRFASLRRPLTGLNCSSTQRLSRQKNFQLFEQECDGRDFRYNCQAIQRDFLILSFIPLTFERRAREFRRLQGGLLARGSGFRPLLLFATKSSPLPQRCRWLQLACSRGPCSRAAPARRRRMRRLRCSRRSRRLFFPVTVASRFFLNSGCFAKSGTANGDGAFMQRVKHPQLLDNRSSRESLAQSAFAFPNAFEIEIVLHSTNCR